MSSRRSMCYGESLWQRQMKAFGLASMAIVHVGALAKLRCGSMKPILRRLQSDGRACLSLEIILCSID